MLRATALLGLISGASAGAVELTGSNFDDLVTKSGKNAFVKWHCKSMKPAWDQLGDEYSSSSSVVIGDADCTASAKDLCETYEYFTAEAPKGTDYSGGRDFDSLKKFVEDELEVKCLIDNDEARGCSDKEKDFMSKWKAKDKSEVAAQLERLNKMKWVVQRSNILKQL
ncbi:hypothetical protein EMIHUDRAFT_210547 [Emiliania huxleyi CCMP1516]|uniref:Uncharacterized protein n=2 Tax=Emiliania huxleyi TaxID=2903 RepID=A0A0D3HY76_EMIH1|nr:hypothetical protein EMIHUDRAFT_221785 [Emiliania huxleyi CCMP1516]XP_005768670.1 hypothetical protein EMIHUDRAFT_210547 [Emiliania huxleyi CCMP1516]EOD03961.1 hypothetical protein EMIHUDRAFT_221785 [Emiliania huxleyi CCMP1516]EOD16241.1 hypothetical protein EMIHUDRAFT_210547 [Emiliania huxleyi CCMP1516]|eukprot:XP_005756390.1 hypothetical protein EMIHUDRAFT_221785 [Emiliania huxleyi CCMP1516]